MHDDLVLIEAGLVRDRLARVLGGTRQLQSLGTVEAGREPDLAGLVGVNLKQDLSICLAVENVDSVDYLHP